MVITLWSRYRGDISGPEAMSFFERVRADFMLVPVRNNFYSRVAFFLCFRNFSTTDLLLVPEPISG